MNPMGHDITLNWIRFEFPVHSIDRWTFEKTLRQIRNLKTTEPTRNLPWKEAA